MAVTFRVPEPAQAENRPDLEGPGGSSLVAGVRYEARKRKRSTEAVRVSLESRGMVRLPFAVLALHDGGPAAASPGADGTHVSQFIKSAKERTSRTFRSVQAPHRPRYAILPSSCPIRVL